MPPTESMEPRDVEKLARHAVGLRGVPLNFAGEADDTGDTFGQFFDGEVDASADVDDVWAVEVLEQEEDGVGEVVGKDELTPCRACAPEGDARRVQCHRFGKPADQSRDD